MRISPSIASSNLVNIEFELERIGNDFDTLHVDIEDGNFVDNITFGLKTVRLINEISKRPFSVHLMVSEPEKYIDALKEFNCDIIFFHVENQGYPRKLISKIKSFGFKAGIALNPITITDHIDYLASELDGVLFMTSEPDLQGENFNVNILEKIKGFSDKYEIEIWADGGVKMEYRQLLHSAGVTTCVVGRDVFLSDDPITYIQDFQSKLF
jgi:ribulose-phosphate 3-epimerase/protein sgcE